MFLPLKELKAHMNSCTGLRVPPGLSGVTDKPTELAEKLQIRMTVTPFGWLVWKSKGLAQF